MPTAFEGISVAGEAADGDAALKELKRLQVLGDPVDVVLMGRISNPAPTLTHGEVQLLELLATGLSNRAVAKQVFISEATVKTHLVHIHGVDNRTAAVAARLS